MDVFWLFLSCCFQLFNRFLILNNNSLFHIPDCYYMLLLITQKWNELDFMGTNEVTSLDVFMLDDNSQFLITNSLFSQFEDLESHSANTYLTDVLGVLISFTNLQYMKRPNGQHCMMRDLTLQNLRYLYIPTLLICLNRNLETNGIKDTPVVVVVSSTYVRRYQGKYSLSSTNTTKVFFNLAIPEVLDMRE
ncbi:hypothetical protein MKW98_004320, partial [Papaver atlanticum]